MTTSKRNENTDSIPEKIKPLSGWRQASGLDDVAYDSQGKEWNRIPSWTAWRNVTDWREIVKRIELDGLVPGDFRLVIVHTLNEESIPSAVNYLRYYLPEYLECLKEYCEGATDDELTADYWVGENVFMSHAIDENGELTPEFRRGVLALAAYFREEDRQAAP